MRKLIPAPIILGLASIALVPRLGFSDGSGHLLNLKPNRCVALHQGQVCYQEVVFEWRKLDSNHNYCIVEEGKGKPLHCWLGGRAGQFNYDFGSEKSSRYFLQKEDGSVIHEVELVVAWVYKSRRKRSSGWRLF